MSYYSRNYRGGSDDWWVEIILPLIICAVFLFAIMFGTNKCSASDWNGGECPKCETRYELRGASRGLKYYSCPECGKEVERY